MLDDMTRLGMVRLVFCGSARAAADVGQVASRPMAVENSTVRHRVIAVRVPRHVLGILRYHAALARMPLSGYLSAVLVDIASTGPLPPSGAGAAGPGEGRRRLARAASPPVVASVVPLDHARRRPTGIATAETVDTADAPARIPPALPEGGRGRGRHRSR